MSATQATDRSASDSQNDVVALMVRDVAYFLLHDRLRRSCRVAGWLRLEMSRIGGGKAGGSGVHADGIAEGVLGGKPLHPGGEDVPAGAEKER
jgi:hypothetical protein